MQRNLGLARPPRFWLAREGGTRRNQCGSVQGLGFDPFGPTGGAVYQTTGRPVRQLMRTERNASIPGISGAHALSDAYRSLNS